MKPHRLSDLLEALYKRTNSAFSPGRQKNEWMEALEAVGIRPEHGNRGPERESLVLVHLAPGELLLRVQRPEGYEDVHPDLVVVDMAPDPVESMDIMVPRAMLEEVLRALRCSEPYVGNGFDHTALWERAINAVDLALSS